MRLQTLFFTAWNFLISYQCPSRTLQTSRTSGTYYSQVCAPETCQHHLAWQDVERLVHLKELHQRDSCWECKNMGRKELLLSIYAFSGRWGGIAASCFFIIIHSPLSPLGQELCRNPVHPTRLDALPQCISCASHMPKFIGVYLLSRSSYLLYFLLEGGHCRNRPNTERSKYFPFRGGHYQYQPKLFFSC